MLSWNDSPTANKTRVAFSARPDGGVFGATAAIVTRTLQSGENSQDDVLRGLALDDAGDLAAASSLLVDVSGTTTDTLQAHVRPAGQASFTHATLDSRSLAPSSSVFAPALVLDASRTATVVWANSAEQLVAASTTPGGTAFSVPASFTAATPGSCAGDDVAPIIAPLAGGGLAGLISAEAFPPLCFGQPLVPLSPAGGAAVTAQPAIAPAGAWALRLVPDGTGDAFAPVSFSPDQASVPVIAYDATPPTVGAVSAPASVAAGSSASLSLFASDAISGVSVSWSFGDGQSGSGPAASHTWAAPGTYTVTATATDGAGNTASSAARVVVLDETPPVISNDSLAHKSFALGPGKTAVSARKHGARHKPPRGTTISFTLSESATVKLTITHTTTGKRSGKRCRATHSRHIAKHSAASSRRATARSPVAHWRPGRIGSRSADASGIAGSRRVPTRCGSTPPTSPGNQAKPRTLSFKIVTA